jgi:hypothetical protein
MSFTSLSIGTIENLDILSIYARQEKDHKEVIQNRENILKSEGRYSDTLYKTYIDINLGIGEGSVYSSEERDLYLVWYRELWMN